jgi:hypothetical protein
VLQPAAFSAPIWAAVRRTFHSVNSCPSVLPGRDSLDMHDSIGGVSVQRGHHAAGRVDADVRRHGDRPAVHEDVQVGVVVLGGTHRAQRQAGLLRPGRRHPGATCGVADDWDLALLEPRVATLCPFTIGLSKPINYAP